jgi:hypothetical protein
VNAVLNEECLNGVLSDGTRNFNMQFGSPDGIVTTAYETIRTNIGGDIMNLTDTKFTEVLGNCGYSLTNRTQAIDHYSMVLAQQCDSELVKNILEGTTDAISTSSANTLTTLFNEGTHMFSNRHVGYSAPTITDPLLNDAAAVLVYKSKLATYYSKVATRALNVSTFFNKWFNDKFMVATRRFYIGKKLDTESIKIIIIEFRDSFTKVIGRYRQPVTNGWDVITALPGIIGRDIGYAFVGIFVSIGTFLKGFVDVIAKAIAGAVGGPERTVFTFNGWLPYTEGREDGTLMTAFGGTVCLFVVAASAAGCMSASRKA